MLFAKKNQFVRSALCILLMILFDISFSFSSGIIDNTYYDGLGDIYEKMPLLKDSVFIGDSYTECMADDLGLKDIAMCHYGFKVRELPNLIISANNLKRKYVIIFLGPNDFGSQTGFEDFERDLGGYVYYLHDTSPDTNIILCSYLDSEFTDRITEERKYDQIPKHYDAVIRKICSEQEYNNVHYLNLWGINDYHHYKRDANDDCHFSKDFNLLYINRLYKLLDELERKIK